MITKIMLLLIVALIMCVCVLEYYFLQLYKKALEGRCNYAERYKAYYEVLLQVRKNKKKRRSMEEYFEKKNVRKISIYGKGTMGSILYDEIDKNKINIVCFIDSNAKKNELFDGIVPVVNVENELIANSELIVVTPVHDYEEIVKKIRRKGNRVPIVSFEEVVYNYNFEF